MNQKLVFRQKAVEEQFACDTWIGMLSRKPSAIFLKANAKHSFFDRAIDSCRKGGAQENTGSSIDSGLEGRRVFDIAMWILISEKKRLKNKKLRMVILFHTREWHDVLSEGDGMQKGQGDTRFTERFCGNRAHCNNRRHRRE